MQLKNRTDLLTPLILLLTVLLQLLTIGCSESPELKYARLQKQAAEYSAQNRLNEARLIYANLIDLEPQIPDNYFELAQILLRQKDFTKALATYKSVINLNPSHFEARLHIAGLYLGAGQPEMAEDHVLKLIAQDPKSIEARVLEASLKRARKDNDGALQQLSELNTAHPDNVLILANLGDISIALGKYRDAEDYLQQALKLDPANQSVRVSLADVFASEGRLDDAQTLLDSVIEKDPKNASLRFFYSEFLLGRGYQDQAVQQYQEILKTEPLRWEAREKLYDLYLIRNQADSALALGTELEKKYENESGTVYFRGRNHETRGKTRAALFDYLKALEGMPNFAPVFRRAGLLELVLADRSQALEHLRQALGSNEFDVGARLALGRDAFSQGEFSLALEHANKVLQRYPRQIGANILRADVALAQDNLDQARAAYLLLIDTFPESPIGYHKLGILEEKAKNLDAAAKYFRKAVAFDRDVLGAGRRLLSVVNISSGWDNAFAEGKKLLAASKNSKPEYSFLLGSLILSKDQPAPADLTLAATYIDQAIADRPTLVDAYSAKALLYRMKKNLPEAAKSFEEAAKLAPKDVPILMDLALTYEQLQQYDKAADAYRRVLQADRRHGMAANNLAWLLVDRLNGNLDEAFENATLAKEEFPKEPSVTDTLGWIYHRRGQSRAGLELVQEAIQLDRERRGESSTAQPEMLYHLGAIKLALGDRKNAEEIFQRALATGGENFKHKAEIQKLLATSSSVKPGQEK